MAAGIAILVVAVVVVTFFVLAGLRRWERDMERTEARLRSPDTHTVAYRIPEGQDPAVLTAALAREGYTYLVTDEGGVERLVVECDEQDRARVREIIEHVDRAGFEGPEIHVGHVTFEDER